MSVPGGAVGPGRGRHASSASCRRTAAAASLTRADARAARRLPRARRRRPRTSGRPRRRSTAASATGSPRGWDDRARARAHARSPRRSSRAGRCAWSTSTRRRAAFPPLYEQLRAQRPGMFARSAAWWETRRLADDPARAAGRRRCNRALLELDGAPAGYAIYRVEQDWAAGGRARARSTSSRRSTPDARGDARALALPARLRLDVAVRRPTCCRSTIRSSCCSPSRGGCASRSTTGSGCGWSTSARRWRRARYAGDGEVVLEVRDAFLPGEQPAGGASRPRGAERTDARRRHCARRRRRSAPSTSAASRFADLARALAARGARRRARSTAPTRSSAPTSSRGAPRSSDPLSATRRSVT